MRELGLLNIERGLEAHNAALERGLEQDLSSVRRGARTDIGLHQLIKVGLHLKTSATIYIQQ